MVMASSSAQLYEWQAFGASVIGGKHLATGTPKQDALRWMPVSGRGQQVILALADGHGAGPYFRSSKGANYAVYTALDALKEFFQSYGHSAEEGVLLPWLEEEFPDLLVERWRESVYEDLAQTPLTEEESQQPAGELSDLAESDLIPYGTTLTVLAVSDHFVMALQLGRGDILSLSVMGEITTLASSLTDPQDGRRQSLCRTDAPKLFKSTFFPLGSSPPALLAACSDGYRKALGDLQPLRSRVVEHLAHLHEYGLLATSERLERQLQSYAKGDDRDDLSVGLIYQLGQLTGPATFQAMT